jgi:hypothetical protein
VAVEGAGVVAEHVGHRLDALAGVDEEGDCRSRAPDLALLRATRADGAEAAFQAHGQQLLQAVVARALHAWLATPNWTSSRDFAMAHSNELLHPVTLTLVDGLGDRAPGKKTVRLHRGLLHYAASEGFDAAYELLQDPRLRQAALEKAASGSPNEASLALARSLNSGRSDDDPEAHFTLVVTTLLAGDEGEAAAALADCADRAAPCERRDFVRRLEDLAIEHPGLGAAVPELGGILEAGAPPNPVGN